MKPLPLVTHKWDRQAPGTKALRLRSPPGMRCGQVAGRTVKPSRWSSMHLIRSPDSRTMDGSAHVSLSNKSILSGRVVENERWEFEAGAPCWYKEMRVAAG